MIIPLTEADHSRCRADQTGRRLLLDESVAILALPLEQTDEEHGLLGTLVSQDRVHSRGVLVQSALDPAVYYEIGEAADRLAQGKLLATVMFCQILGARSVIIEEASRINGTERVEFKSEGKRVGARANLDRSALDVERMVHEASLMHDFAGRPADLDAAYEHLRQSGLDQDAHLLALIRMREHDNALTRQQLRISTRTESQKLRRWVSKAKIPFGEVKAEIDSVINESVEYDFAFTVEFDQPRSDSPPTDRIARRPR